MVGSRIAPFPVHGLAGPGEPVEDQEVEAPARLQDMIGAGQTQDTGADHHDVMARGHIHALPPRRPGK